MTTGAFTACTKKQTNPNVLLIVVDDLGWTDLGCYGSSFYESPHIDRLASQGMRFTNAYASCPVCSPTRAALLTGKSPAKLQFTGHITAIGRHRHPENSRIIPPDDLMHIRLKEITIAEALKPAGYRSASIGKWHVGDEEKYYPTAQGFDVNIAGYNHGSPPGYFWPYTDPDKEWNPGIPTLHGGKPGEYLTDRLTDEAINFMQESGEQPFFVYLPYYAVHTPLQAPQELIEKYEKKLERDKSQKNAVYAAMVEKVDTNVGRLMAYLQEKQIDNNTLVILVSDNGGLATVTNNAPLRAGKGFLYEGGIRVPMIVKWPGKVKSGSINNTPVISHDILPTIAEIVHNSQISQDVEGASLKSVLTGNTQLAERELYWYYPHYSPQAKQPAAAIRDGQYKLLRFYDPVKTELYDLSNDLSEQHDLYEQMPEKVQELGKKLDDWLKSVNAKMHTLNKGYKTVIYCNLVSNI